MTELLQVFLLSSVEISVFSSGFTVKEKKIYFL